MELPENKYDAETPDTASEETISEDTAIDRSENTENRPSDYAVPAGHRTGKHYSSTKAMDPDRDDGDDFIFARYHGKKGHSYSSNHSHNETVVRSTKSDPHRRKHGRKKHADKKNRTWWQKLLIILAWIFGSIAGLILLAAITILILSKIGIIQLTDYTDMYMTAPDIDGMHVSLSDSGRTVEYKGKTYLFNEDVTSILCMGVDKLELGLEDDMVGTGGQADAIYMIALDTNTGKTSVIGIPRDIVTDIGIYSPDGEYLHTEKMQLCLAYAYGDGRKTSCLNTVTAVSRLFYNLPINSYYAIDLSAIAELNDAVGGVTVTMIDNSFYDTNLVQHFKGETFTLYGDNARKYLQQREVSQLESSMDRMNRQMNYLKAFSSKAITMTKNDLSTPVSLYNIISDSSETNLTTSKITAFATCLVSNGVSELDFKQVPGEITRGETYAEYVVEEEGLYEMILDTFYTPAE